MIYNFNEWTKDTFLYKNVSHFILEKGPQFVVTWEIDGETYTPRKDFFQEPGGANTCTPLQACQRRLWLTVCPSFDPILSTLSKSDRVVLITWSPSGYTPVVPKCPDVLLYPCLLITAWQLFKAHGITRSKPKIHAICYITHCHCSRSTLAWSGSTW